MQILRLAWAVHDERALTHDSNIAVREKAGSMTGSETFTEFVSDVASETLRKLLRVDPRSALSSTHLLDEGRNRFRRQTYW